MMRQTIERTAVALLLSLPFGLPAMAQVGGGFDLTWNTFDDGGYMWSAGGSYSLAGTIGQPDASTAAMTGGPFTLTGGFWFAAGACGSPRQDADLDGDVDMFDFLDFQACFNGPNQTWQAQGDPAKCACLDHEDDGDVDMADFIEFQACFNGPNNPPACS